MKTSVVIIAGLLIIICAVAIRTGMARISTGGYDQKTKNKFIPVLLLALLIGIIALWWSYKN